MYYSIIIIYIICGSSVIAITYEQIKPYYLYSIFNVIVNYFSV